MRQEPAPKLVSVIIVNFNGKDILSDCLKAVLAQNYTAFEVLLIDNASSDGSADFVEASFPSIRVVRSPVNLGFAGGNNLGYAEARGEYVALLNTDAVPDRSWLGRLVDGLERRELVLASSQVVTDGVPSEEYEMNGTINYLGYNLPREFRDLETVFYCSAAALLVKRDAIDELFPEEFFLYQEDLHLSWKMRLKGARIGMVPHAGVTHRGSFSTQRLRNTRVAYFHERNRLLNCLVFYQLWTLVRLVPYFVFDAGSKFLLGILGRGKPPGAILRAYAGVLARLGWVFRTRGRLQKTRTVPDREILALMTYRVVRGGGKFSSALNGLSRGYARLAGLAFHG